PPAPAAGPARGASRASAAGRLAAHERALGVVHVRRGALPVVAAGPVADSVFEPARAAGVVAAAAVRGGRAPRPGAARRPGPAAGLLPAGVRHPVVLQ